MLGVWLLSSCSTSRRPVLSAATASAVPAAPDYFNLDAWAAHPFRQDPSDSIPAPLRQEKRDSAIDVFFIHPTTYTAQRYGWNADPQDISLNARTEATTILFQASAFNQHGRVFAPRYRQAHLSAFFTDSAEALAAFDTAYADLKKAFEIYLENWNKGRPLIIAGHSQGGKMAIRLLKEFFDGKPLQKKLVAAYIIGWPVARNSFEEIPVCTDSLKTGCFCSWRTFRQDYLPGYIEKEFPVAEVTNPLSWTTTEKYVGRAYNQGSVLRNFNRVIKNTTDAQVHGGVLWVNRPKFPGSIFFNTRNYHIGDINLFYINLRKNLEQRILSYLGQP